MSRRGSITRQADSKGRLTLGPKFANRILLVEERGDEILVRLGRVVPESEAWLYENPKALDSVRRGLEQARSRKFAPGKGPDLKSAAKLGDSIPES